MREKPTLEEAKKMPYEPDPVVEEWMRSRPNSIKRAMVKFPPDCIIKSKPGQDLMCPKVGGTAVVLSWTEPTPENPEGQVSCFDYPNGKVRAFCKTDWVEVVAYTRGMTPEKVMEIFGWTKPEETWQ